MDSQRKDSGAQFRADRPVEQEAVRTTIVGGRPPGSGGPVGDIPRGVEVLVKKASIDPDFKILLLEKRSAAAESIGLKLDPTEAFMINAAPVEQLETIIGHTSVPQQHRRAFLGMAAATMLAALGVVTTGCPDSPAPKGIRPDRPSPVTEGIRPDRPSPAGERPDLPNEEPPPAVKGIRPDNPGPTKGIRPDRIEPTDGIRPDLPKRKSEQ